MGRISEEVSLCGKDTICRYHTRRKEPVWKAYITVYISKRTAPVRVDGSCYELLQILQQLIVMCIFCTLLSGICDFAVISAEKICEQITGKLKSADVTWFEVDILMHHQVTGKLNLLENNKTQYIVFKLGFMAQWLIYCILSYKFGGRTETWTQTSEHSNYSQFSKLLPYQLGLCDHGDGRGVRTRH